jgi:HSP20 family protein
MLVRWNPWSDFSRFDKELTALFGRNGEASRAGSWQPAVDVREDAQKIQIVADLPGVEEKDVEISVEKNVLTLKGERKTESQSDEGGYHRYERVSGSFVRAFTLPTTVDAEKVSASMKAGVLTLTLPKKPEAQPQKIKINVA